VSVRENTEAELSAKRTYKLRVRHSSYQRRGNYLRGDIRDRRGGDTCHPMEPCVSRACSFDFVLVNRAWRCKNMLVCLL